jgi:hypothetical protein
MEQGIDALLEFRLFEDTDGSGPWPFEGWDVNATVSDSKGLRTFPVTVDVNPAEGIVRLIFPQGFVNSLRVGRPYRYDCIMVAPGDQLADDQHLWACGDYGGELLRRT